MTRVPGRDHEISYLAAILAGFAALLLACTHIVPQELVDARIAFERTEYGPAGTYMPVELNIAEEALDLAQATFQANGDTPLVRDQANAALRMTELVEAMADMARRSTEAQRRQYGAAP